MENTMLSPEQIMFIGFVATAITLALKLLAQWGGYTPGRAPLTILLYAVSLVLGGIWTGVYLPPFPPFADPVSFVGAALQFVADLLAMLAPVVGIATLIYNLLYEKVVVPAVAKVRELRGAK
jgi:hypothetical protein